MESPTSRQERISWWQQDTIRAARIAVIGAGALGNEVLKNLALIGVGEIHIFDFDVVEISNLSRTLLFRPEDAEQKRSKALTAAQRLQDLNVNPQAVIEGHHLDVVWDLGGGFLRGMDCVLGCLDNVEARLAVARHCYQFSVPFIDGGIQELDGRVQLHKTGSGACFDCSIGESERTMLRVRYSCEQVMRAHVAAGLIPTVQMTSAFIASLMCQEAVKCLHGRQTSFGSVLSWFGGITEFDRLQMQQAPHCLTCSVEPLSPIHDLPLDSRNTGRELVDMLPADWRIILPSAFITALRCHPNGHSTPLGKPSHRCVDTELVCPIDGNTESISLEKIECLDRNSPPQLLERSLIDLGIPDQASLYGQNHEQTALFVLNRSSSPGSRL